MNETPAPSPGPGAAQAEVTGKDALGLALDRTTLASYRVKLALDRTTLAWIRTGLTMATFGFGLVAFFRTLVEEHPENTEAARFHEGAIKMGLALLFLGIVATVLAGVSHWSALRRLRHGEAPTVTYWALSLTVAVLMSCIGLAGLYFLLTR